MVLHLGGDELGEVAERLRSIKDLQLRSVMRTAHTWLRALMRLTFFITPTASSVCVTNSSSAFSISSCASGLISASSCVSARGLWAAATAGTGIFHVFPLALPLAASSVRRDFSTPLRARVANMMLVFRVVFHPARKRLWI